LKEISISEDNNEENESDKKRNQKTVMPTAETAP